mgnify:CR=1 FL=1
MDGNERMAREVNILRDAYGREVILVDEEGKEKEQTCRILSEIELDGCHYCVLRMEGDGNDDAYIFRVGDDFKIEPIEDEDEWERAAEAVDELLYFNEN